MNKQKTDIDSFSLAKDKYMEIGVDVEKAMKCLSEVSLSIHCWQGDDVRGFERPDAQLQGGGIQATGNFPGRPRNLEELRADMDKMFSFVPGIHRLNLHASYLENKGKFVDRNEIQVEHFQSWIDWAGERKLGLDFNPTCFSHPLAESGFTLSSEDKEIQEFWIEHCIACRKIANEMGRQLNTPCITNIWIPDGYKDIPVDRKAPRERLKESLDKIFTEIFDPRFQRDSVESKLFGIGSESYVVGSHEFYLGYAISRKKILCLDSGHFHPTEDLSDKISSVLMFLDEILLHISRPVRWDSDHVVILDDETLAIAQAMVRGNYLEQIHIGLDFFDASINRVAAWILGARSVLKALLRAKLEPIEKLMELERNQDYTARLALLEEMKMFPFGAVWDQYCKIHEVPLESHWLNGIKEFENSVLLKRN